MNADIISFAAGSLVAAASAPLTANGRKFVASMASRLALAQNSASTPVPTKRRRATLTIAPNRKRTPSKLFGQHYCGLFECAGYSIWMEDPAVLALVAYVMNVGTVDISLPTFREQACTVRAHHKALPREVVDLEIGISKSLKVMQNEMGEGLFARRFIEGWRRCTQGRNQVESLLSWYRQQLAKAIKAVPADLRVNQRV